MKFEPDIDIRTFKNFVLLEDPYENAKNIAKHLAEEPFNKEIYVGGQSLEGNPDVPAVPQVSSQNFLLESTKSYFVVKVDTRVCRLTEDVPVVPVAHAQRTSTDDRDRGLLEKLGHWEVKIHQERIDKAKKSDAKNPLVPPCLYWDNEQVLSWLTSVGLDRYQETFRKNGINGIRLCILDTNRLVKMGIHDWNDLKKLASQIGRETGLLPRPGPHKRDASLRPLSEVELYFEWKNVLGSRSETLSLRQFVIKNQDVIWDRPEESLQYPGMIIHYDHHKRFNLGLRF